MPDLSLRYPPELPLTGRKDDILAAIRDHQVVIVAGETGSGKTTQLPKICLELGRGSAGLIGHTQPRRLAARTVAERIAEELDTPLGEVVGYQVRFTARVGGQTRVKLMTDGILLAEIAQDRLLRRYDTLIIDEAHERSLNVDFILGYLRRLLPRRPDLKVVITSATIDVERFSHHFDNAPVIEVSGRTYPVQLRYRPPDEETDQVEAIGAAVDELCAEGPGDILVFLSGEREIRDTADALAGRVRPGTEILPLFARLSTVEQHRVFAPHPGRRIVLATNVAETSLTVPGIRYVVDPGTARISRYSHRLKVQRLPIEPVSQASANQRAGRCGRVAEGICIRLYDEKDFLARPEFTDPEILRTNLASVILQMAALGLGEVAEFPFLDPPDRRAIRDGTELLVELGALDADHKLTKLGRRLAQVPIDPRLGRMVLAGDEQGALREVLVIAAALSIQDPRERPADRQDAATQAHARFRDKESDFASYLNLWHYLMDKQKELSGNQFRKLCRAEFLNYLRVREWQDLHTQIRQVARTLGGSLNSTPAEPAQIHRALLSGLLSHVGVKDPEKGDYLGARGARFAVFPGSTLFRRTPRWVMAAELVETNRLWARVCARIEPQWLEPLADHLVKRSYSEPHWDRERGAVMAYERVTLYGIPIVTRRLVNYGRVDAPLARELFIRHALVEGDWETRHRFFHDNAKLLAEVEELEHRARRRDIVVDDAVLFAFYDRRVGPDVVSGRHFDTWWKKTRQAQPDLLTLDRATLLTATAGAVRAEDFPSAWRQGPLELPLRYRFQPGAADDGVTVEVPLPVLGRVAPAAFAWQVPGLREELVIALIRTLPKPLRREFVPVPDYARAALAQLSTMDGDLLDALELGLRRLAGVPVPHDAWQPDKVPEHLKMNFRVLDESGAVVGEGRDLAQLQRELSSRIRESLAQALPSQAGLRDWTVGTLPQTVEQIRAGYRVTGYPALVDEGDSVAVRVFETAAEQRIAHRAGVRRLLRLALPAPATVVQGRLDNAAKLALLRSPHGNVNALLDDCADCAVDALMPQPPWDEAGYRAVLVRVRGGLTATVVAVLGQVRQIVALATEVAPRIDAAPEPARTDLRDQLAGLVYPGFVTATGWSQLPQLPRYLRAAQRRLDRLAENPARDRDQLRAISDVQREYAELSAQAPPGHPAREALDRIRWMIEELRVAVYAQALGTAYPVSDKRIRRALDELTEA
ncbi:MAG: ATP-dependent RNA helicase HrpA [Actinobacteria bacterium]|nr:MAG: ATP-dependent RNA helicase HrpA [Actinomycetota bacterium]